MKIRNGFVSNSSTSSFVIWGVKISESKSQKLHEDGVEEFIYELSEKDKRFAKMEGCHGMGENFGYEEHFIGLPPDEMKDEETLLEFKQRIADLVTEAGIPATAKQVKFYADAGNDNY